MSIQDGIVMALVALCVGYFLRSALGLGGKSKPGCGCGTAKCPIQEKTPGPKLVSLEEN